MKLASSKCMCLTKQGGMEEKTIGMENHEQVLLRKKEWLTENYVLRWASWGRWELLLNAFAEMT